jgi:hypothetical protein
MCLAGLGKAKGKGDRGQQNSKKKGKGLSCAASRPIQALTVAGQLDAKHEVDDEQARGNARRARKEEAKGSDNLN